MMWPNTILISRTDSIGDVMLTLPLAGLLRKHYPKARLVFLGRAYTEPVLERCVHIDEVITLEELEVDNGRNAVERLKSIGADAVIHVFPEERIARWAKAAGIRHRIGTSHRWWHWLTVNERVSFSRRKSALHEAQLNTKLLQPFGIAETPSLDELTALSGFTPPPPDDVVNALLRTDRVRVVLHPYSRGSGAEWGSDRFAELIRLMHPRQFQVIITGTAAEAERYRTALPIDLPHVTDTGGALTLRQLLALIGASDALVASGTGPLHIAAASGIRTIGLFPTRRPIHPGRWAPLGIRVNVLVDETLTYADPKEQVHAIRPERVLRLLEQVVTVR